MELRLLSVEAGGPPDLEPGTSSMLSIRPVVGSLVADVLESWAT